MWPRANDNSIGPSFKARLSFNLEFAALTVCPPSPPDMQRGHRAVASILKLPARRTSGRNGLTTVGPG